MENLTSSQSDYKLSFHGKGSEYFGVIIVNWLLTVITLGLYYPWAKAKQLKFMYGSTALNEDRFAFHGTGKEMFKGFLKTLVLFAIIFILFGIFTYLKMPIVGLLVLYLAIFAIMPIAIHGSYRYRMSRTSWRGIRFGYRGDRNELVKNFFTWLFFTIITLGIYGSWFAVNLRNYVMSKIRFGDIEFKWEAEGLDYFLLNLKGYLLTLVTLGIYMFWWQKNLFEFYVNNLSLQKGEQKVQFTSTATGGGFFKLMIVNLLLVIFTLGLGYAWAATRTMDYILSNIQLQGNIDLNSISQTEQNYTDATGDDINDFLNIDFII
jgi:uncharacterized membrane protein YjgN (DUF898 family)